MFNWFKKKHVTFVDYDFEIIEEIIEPYEITKEIIEPYEITKEIIEPNEITKEIIEPNAYETFDDQMKRLMIDIIEGIFGVDIKEFEN